MLGPLEAWHDGEPVALGDQQQLFVLVVLLLNANKPVTSERIVNSVWDGNQARRDMVRTYIRRLRGTFQGSDVSIETTSTGYLLRVEENQLDTVRYDRLRVQAESVRAGDPRRAVELLRQAVDLWRGGFLEDINIDRVGGTEVISPDDSYPDVVGDLAELEIAVGDHRSARDRLRNVVKKHPANQKHAELLMRALLAGGDPTAAIQVFHTIREALAEDGYEPGPTLRNLHARAKHGEPPSSLPSRSLVFTGRDAELVAITTPPRTAWVSGPPGVGKTALAIEAAYQLRDRYPDGQLLVELNGYTPGVPATTVGDALTRLLTELGVPPEQIPATDRRKGTLYQMTLYGTRTLVVLDNAASPDQIRQLLPDEPGCFAIVTSRRMGEPDTGGPVRLSPLPPDEAVALFRRLTDTPRTRGRSAEVAEVVERCGFLPVRIHVVGALFRRHDQWPLEHLLRLLAESGPWGAGGVDGSAAAFRVSYQQLDEPRRAMFRLLGHLPGPDLDVIAAAALVDSHVATARMLLDELHEVSLVEEGATERYRMLDPVKEFAAAEEPITPTERAGAMLRLLDYYLVTLGTAVAVGYPFDRIHLPVGNRSCPVTRQFRDADVAKEWIGAERNNLVAAIHHAATHDLPEHAWRLAVLMWRYFNATAHIEDWLATLERAWDIVSADPGNEYGQAHVLLRLSIANDRLGRIAEALELAAQALPKWVRLGDIRGEAATLCALAIPTMELGKYKEAVAHFYAALGKYEQVDDPRGQAHAQSNLGYLNEELGDLDLALRQHESAVRMSREIGDIRGLAHSLSNLGSVQQKLGQFEEALASYTEAHRHAVAAGDRSAKAYALNDIGTVYRLTGRFAEAARYQEQAKVAAVEVKDADLQFQLYLDRGATANAKGDLGQALSACRAALDSAVGTKNPVHQARANHAVAGILHVLGRHEQAIQHWDGAEEGFTALDVPEAAEVRAERAVLTCACGSTGESRRG
jgi:DNA-binding SARP family transcriptional activator/tetratricopeptide (TPR) repeat protein